MKKRSVVDKTCKPRWNEESLAIGNNALLNEGESPFLRLVNGRRDFRGLIISRPIKNVSVIDTDLSGCATKGFGQFDVRHVNNCLFQQARLDTNVGYGFLDCDFTDARLAGGVLRGKFTNCNFTCANLSSVMGPHVRFFGCTFRETNFSKSTLIHCLFEECHFIDSRFGGGSFAYSRFIRSCLQSVDLGDTLMTSVVYE